MARTRMFIPIDRQNLRTKFTAFALELFWPNPGGGGGTSLVHETMAAISTDLGCLLQLTKTQGTQTAQTHHPSFPASKTIPKQQRQATVRHRSDGAEIEEATLFSLQERFEALFHNKPDGRKQVFCDFAIKNKSFNFRPFHQGHRFIYVHCTCMSTIFFAATLATQRKDCIRCGPIWRRRCSF